MRWRRAYLGNDECDGSGSVSTKKREVFLSRRLRVAHAPVPDVEPKVGRARGLLWAVLLQAHYLRGSLRGSGSDLANLEVSSSLTAKLKAHVIASKVKSRSTRGQRAALR